MPTPTVQKHDRAWILENRWTVRTVADVDPFTGAATLEGLPNERFVFFPQLTEWATGDEGLQQARYEAWAKGWRTHDLAQLPTLSIPSLDDFRQLARALHDEKESGFLHLDLTPSEESRVAGLAVPIRAYVRAPVPQRGMPLSDRIALLAQATADQRDRFTLAFGGALARLLLDLAERNLRHNALVPANVRVVENEGAAGLTLLLGCPGDDGTDVYGDQRPYLDWKLAAVLLGVVGHVRQVDLEDLQAGLRHGMFDAHPRFHTGADARLRFLRRSWRSLFPGGTFHGGEELRELAVALFSEASYGHGGLDLVRRVAHICDGSRERLRPFLNGLRGDLAALEEALADQLVAAEGRAAAAEQAVAALAEEVAALRATRDRAPEEAEVVVAPSWWHGLLGRTLQFLSFQGEGRLLAVGAALAAIASGAVLGHRLVP